MQLACSPISLARTIKSHEMNTHGFIRYCADLSFEGVEIFDTRSFPWFWKDAGDVRHCLQWAAEAGITICGYACENNFARTDSREFEREVAIVLNAIDEAALCGAPVLRIFGGYHRENGGEAGLNTAEAFGMICAGLERCLPHAEARGVVLGLENHGRLPGHSYELAGLIRRFDSPFLKATFDPANFIANNMDEPEDPLAAYRRLKEMVVHVHVKDFGKPVLDPKRRVEPCLPGRGEVPLRQFLSELHQDGYNGFCSLEYEAGRIIPELEGIPQCLAYFKEAIAVIRAVETPILGTQ
ncbi:MAG TPA: sugar phosphate isomerase/epimerase family protein [Chthoniobacteraceae bacterium]|nr:sugar phosphate isomerase/epimerase family protein [Chthoniobacteraceae bacterium]